MLAGLHILPWIDWLPDHGHHPVDRADQDPAGCQFVDEFLWHTASGIRGHEDAVVHPDPDPTSRTLFPGTGSSSSSMVRTVVGCEQVEPPPMGRAMSKPALPFCFSGRKASRATVSMASSMRLFPPA